MTQRECDGLAGLWSQLQAEDPRLAKLLSQPGRQSRWRSVWTSVLHALAAAGYSECMLGPVSFWG